MKHTTPIFDGQPTVTTSRDGHITIKQGRDTWMLEDSDIVRFFEVATKLKWVIATRKHNRAIGTKEPRLKGYTMAYEAIVKAVHSGQIESSHVVTYVKAPLTDPDYDRWFDTALNA